MQESGVFQFASHTWDHRLIFIGNELIGFAKGTNRTWAYGRSVPLPSDTIEADTGCWQPRATIGRPLYVQRSRMSAVRRFIESPAVRRACEQFASENGGDDFLSNPAGMTSMRTFYDTAVQREGGSGRFESEAEHVESIRASLARSRDVLQDRLGLERVDFLCFPYNESSVFACRLAARPRLSRSLCGAIRHAESVHLSRS